MLSVFNWKKHPENIFLLVIPLAVFGLGLILYSGIIHLVFNNNPWPLIIWVALIVVGIIAIIPAFKYFLKNGDEK